MVHFDFRKLDVFSFGEEQKCLIGSVDPLYRNSWNEVRTLHFNGEQAMIEALKTISGVASGCRAAGQRGGLRYSQHLRGLIRTRVQQMISSASNCVSPVPVRIPGALKRCARLRPDLGTVLRASQCFRCRSWKTPLSSTALLSRNNAPWLSVGVETNALSCRRSGRYSARIIRSFLKTQDNNDSGFNIIRERPSPLRSITTARAAKRSWCATSAAIFIMHDRFTYGSSFINFNLPQFYQIVEVDGRTQVIPFRTQAIAAAIPTSQDVTASPVLQQRYS